MGSTIYLSDETAETLEDEVKSPGQSWDGTIREVAQNAGIKIEEEVETA